MRALVVLIVFIVTGCGYHPDEVDSERLEPTNGGLTTWLLTYHYKAPLVDDDTFVCFSTRSAGLVEVRAMAERDKCAIRGDYMENVEVSWRARNLVDIFYTGEVISPKTDKPFIFDKPSQVRINLIQKALPPLG